VGSSQGAMGMMRRAADYPTGLELQILGILWACSPLPVREVRQRLAGLGREIAHTSTITTLNTMVQKRYLRRKRVKNAYLFLPRVSQQDVTHGMLGDLVDRAFEGSAALTALALFDSRELDTDELKALRELIDQ